MNVQQFGEFHKLMCVYSVSSGREISKTSGRCQQGSYFLWFIFSLAIYRLRNPPCQISQSKERCPINLRLAVQLPQTSLRRNRNTDSPRKISHIRSERQFGSVTLYFHCSCSGTTTALTAKAKAAPAANDRSRPITYCNFQLRERYKRGLAISGNSIKVRANNRIYNYFAWHDACDTFLRMQHTETELAPLEWRPK
jgi:hypothetical protein